MYVCFIRGSIHGPCSMPPFAYHTLRNITSSRDIRFFQCILTMPRYYLLSTCVCSLFLSMYVCMFIDLHGLLRRAFVTQFSRSMHLECWGSGVDFYVVTPFYVRPKRHREGASLFFTPVARTLVLGTLSQIGKQYIWQVRVLAGLISIRIFDTLVYYNHQSYRATDIGFMDFCRL